MKVSEIPYKRLEIERYRQAVDQFLAAADNAKTADEVLAAHDKLLEAVTAFNTAYSLAYCRFTLNTNDSFYEKEMEYYDEVMPLANEETVRYGNAMLASKFRPELEKSLNPLCFKKYEYAKKAYDPSVEKECQEENALVTEYTKLMSGLKVEYKGEALPLSVVRGHLSDDDRNSRREAAEAIGNALGGVSDKLDGLYDKLVKLRTRIAQKLGMKNYVELGYYRMNRIDYDREMIEKFRKNVLESLVPIVGEIKDKIGKELGLDRFLFYDDTVCLKGGNPRPKGNAAEIFAAAKEMYNDMDPEIGAFMEEMLENEAFDVEARDGKWGGGYCIGFDSYKQPFILANFNGSEDDIETITHEFGHAFAAKQSYVQGDPELGVGNMETAECHSMSMEFFCEKYMDKFFRDADAYRRSHLISALSFIPYGSIVDEFQHIVYENPDMTPSERNEAYLSLEKKYRPYLTFDGIPYLEKGTRWQYQMHIYESPFYYIDYCLAQTVSLGFLVAMKENYGDALARYIKFVKDGGTKPFGTLVKEAGLPDPFGDGTLASLAARLKKII